MNEDDVRRVVRDELARVGLACGGEVKMGRPYIVGEGSIDHAEILKYVNRPQSRTKRDL